ncbi:UNVERIFIED_CONTAM: hypothetical protein FKN15_010252 [Acipenser sinensis]
MNCELLATCNALGYLEEDTYHREPDCLESVKDLIRYLRHEDDTRDIRQQLGAGQILQNDLLPLVIQHHQESALFDACIRYPHCTDWEQRQEEDNLLIERILLLVRNVLHVPADPSEEKSLDDDASLHDKLLWAIHMSGMDDLIKFLASSPSEHQWSMHILEVISLLFREQVRGEAGAGEREGRVLLSWLELRDWEGCSVCESCERRDWEGCSVLVVMHLALKAYQELLMTVNEMDRSKDENIRESARVIKSNIFYLMEFREIFLALLRRFDETRQPRSFLQDLVETTHLFLRMLERFCKGRNHLLVQVGGARGGRRDSGESPASC